MDPWRYYTTLHYTTLHYITLHYTTLHYTTLRAGTRMGRRGVKPHATRLGGRGTLLTRDTVFFGAGHAALVAWVETARNTTYTTLNALQLNSLCFGSATRGLA